MHDHSVSPPYSLNISSDEEKYSQLWVRLRETKSHQWSVGGTVTPTCRQVAALHQPCERPERKPIQIQTQTERSGENRGKMAAAAVAEFQRAQSLLGTDRNASIDILHSIGKYGWRCTVLEKCVGHAGSKKSPSDAEQLKQLVLLLAS